MAPLKVTIVGSGNWGSAIARIVGQTAVANPQDFDKTIRMWVFEEMVNGRKLSEIINTDHENVKYLPGKKLPDNVLAVPDLVESCRDANILVFVVPHQFVAGICKQLKGNLGTNVQAISLIKGICNKICGHSIDSDAHTDHDDHDHSDEGLSMQKLGGLRLISEEIKELLSIECNVLMGANLAHEVANDNFCEATIGCPNKKEYGVVLKKLFHTDNFRVTVVDDAHTVELCGALKNIVACAAGFTDGLGYGDNTKAAVIRLGLMEITKFVEHYYPGSNLQTFFESCGVADLITTCYGGRNRKICEAFVTAGKPLDVVEKEMLNGQSAQGPLTAEEVYLMLKKTKLEEKFPLFVAVHHICKGDFPPKQLIDCLRNHPEHMEI